MPKAPDETLSNIIRSHINYDLITKTNDCPYYVVMLIINYNYIIFKTQS